MKQTHILLMLFVATSLLFASCNRREYRTVTIAFDCNCTPQQQLAAYEVINRRIASIWSIREKTELIDGQFTITYSGFDDFLTRILTTRGEIYVTETVPIHWISKISGYLRHLVQPDPAGLFSVPPHKISYIDSVFNQLKDSLPTHTTFAWSMRSNNNGNYTFYALRTSSRRFQPFPFSPNTVKTCSLWENRKGEFQIDIELTEGYHTTAWARLTRDNTGRNLAIVMDGNVVSAPRVQHEISSGKANITGNFERDDLFLIKSAILGGILECTATIIEIPNTN